MSDCSRCTKNLDGYGYARISAKVGPGRYTMIKAHRLAYCQAHGLQLSDIDGFVVRHKCDVRNCVEPTHLELGSNLDNIRDRHERGRDAAGLAHGMAKLSDDDVRSIRKRYVKGSRGREGAVSLAKEFGVHRDTILRIAQGARRENVR